MVGASQGCCQVATHRPPKGGHPYRSITMYELRYMIDREGELIGVYETLEKARYVVRTMEPNMHPEQVADLVIRKVEDGEE